MRWAWIGRERLKAVFTTSVRCERVCRRHDAPVVTSPLSRARKTHVLEPRPADAKHYASEMLGQKLITKQTGEDGLPCDKVRHTYTLRYRITLRQFSYNLDIAVPLRRSRCRHRYRQRFVIGEVQIVCRRMSSRQRTQTQTRSPTLKRL